MRIGPRSHPYRGVEVRPLIDRGVSAVSLGVGPPLTCGDASGTAVGPNECLPPRLAWGNGLASVSVASGTRWDR